MSALHLHSFGIRELEGKEGEEYSLLYLDTNYEGAGFKGLRPLILLITKSLQM